MKNLVLHSECVEKTEKIGTVLAACIAEAMPDTPVFVALYGDLGAGKTAFVRGFASVLSPGSRVKSPTYTVVNEYRKGQYPLFHFDLYRMEEADSLDSIGFDEYVKTGVCIAEWSEHLPEKPENFLSVHIQKTGESSREIHLALPDALASLTERSLSC